MRPRLLRPHTWSVNWRRRAPWAAPVAACLGVAIAAVAPSAFAANPHPGLPARTAQQLIAAVDGSSVRALSGTVTSTPALGLPQLPGSDGGDQLTTFLTERSTWRLWVDGQQRQRVALLGVGQETDLVHNGTSVWTWSSATQEAAHYLYRESPGGEAAATAQAQPDTALSPATAAQQILATIGPSTLVTVGGTARIAGRPAYTLVVEPRTTATLVGKVVIDVDASSGVPLGLQLYGRGEQRPSFGEQFSSVSLTTPAPAEFTFTPPRGAHVATHVERSGSRRRPTVTSAAPMVIGEGWTSVLVIPASPATVALTSSLGGAGTSGGGRSLGGILRDATNPTATGRVVQTRLLSVLFAKDGQILIGAVPAARLEAVAAALPAP